MSSIPTPSLLGKHQFFRKEASLQKRRNQVTNIISFARGIKIIHTQRKKKLISFPVTFEPISRLLFSQDTVSHIRVAVKNKNINQLANKNKSKMHTVKCSLKSKIYCILPIKNDFSFI